MRCPFIQDTTIFPAGIVRGAGFEPEVEEKIAEIVAGRKLPAELPTYYCLSS